LVRIIIGEGDTEGCWTPRCLGVMNAEGGRVDKASGEKG